VLTQLAKLKSLNVISRTSVLQYGRGRPSIPQIAKRLGVEAVVEGSVRYAGSQLMVTAQLIDALTDAHLWTETFRADRSNADGLFAIQTHIATAIAHALGAEITAEEQDRIERVPKHSSAAHARYLRARDEGRRTRFAAALFDLDAALELDPGFADARSWRAYIYAFGQITSNARMMLLNDARFTADTDFQSLALAEASRALELDAGSGVAWLARAVTHQFHFRVQEAREAFQRAHSLSPNDVDILAEYAGFEAQFGDPQAALVLVGRATRLDPGGPLTLYYSAIVQMAAGAADEALASLARALSLDPANPEVHVLAGLFSPDPAAAVRFIRTAEELDSAMLLPGIAQGYRRLGLEGDASRVLDRYDHWVRSGPGRAGAAEWAQYYLLRGDLALTRDWLHEAIAKLERGEADQGFYALVFSFLSQTEPWGSEPRFRELLSRLECLKSRGSIRR
jgi:Tfp pilus assembly protein PilF